MISENEYIEMKRLIAEYEENQKIDKSEVCILVGHLNKEFGFNNFERIKVGTPVYSLKDRYLFYMMPINGGVPVACKFYKETLAPCIDYV